MDDSEIPDPFYVRPWFFRSIYFSMGATYVLGVVALVGLLNGEVWGFLLAVLVLVSYSVIVTTIWVNRVTVRAAYAWFSAGLDGVDAALDRVDTVLHRLAPGEQPPDEPSQEASANEIEATRTGLDRLEEAVAARPNVLNSPVIAALIGGVALVLTAVIAAVVALVD